MAMIASDKWSLFLLQLALLLSSTLGSTVQDVSGETSEDAITSCLPWSKSAFCRRRKPTQVGKCLELDYDRLPTRVRPEHYDLDIKVDIEKFRFEGKVTIFVHAEQSSQLNSKHHDAFEKIKVLFKPAMADVIILHADEKLSLESIEVRVGKNDRKLKLVEICRTADMLKITLNEKLDHDSPARIDISFSGPIKRDDTQGLYTSQQQRPDGRQSDIIDTLTQFEPMSAREVFPCFDEPSFKATFKLRIMHAPHLTALSNTKAINQQSVDGMTLTEFKFMPPMASYLLAFSVGHYDRIISNIKNGKLLVRVFTEKGHSDKADLILKATSDAVLYMEQYTGVLYPLEKLDILAVANFGAGAMENWGLMTFRTSLVYYEPGFATSVLKSMIVKTTAHEVAHQWFGNLVTLNWWSELWLNEAFAEHYSYKIGQAISPDLDLEHYRLKHSLTDAFQADSTPDSFPLQRDGIVKMKDVVDNFSVITYCKGGAVLRMLENLIGEHKWQQAIRSYLAANRMANVKPKDLLDSLGHFATHLSTEQLFQSWFEQPGFPVVYVSTEKRKLKFKQYRFTRYISEHGAELWHIPITLTFVNQNTGQHEAVRTTLSERYGELDIPDWFDLHDKSCWLKVNNDFVGFYYVQYSSELFDRLKVGLNESDLLSAKDKYNLIHELGALVTSGRESAGRLQKLIRWTVGQNPRQHGIVWAAVVENLPSLVNKETNGRALAYRFLAPALEHYGPRSTSQPMTGDYLGRSDVLMVLLDLEHAETIEQALEEFERVADGPVDPDLASFVYLAVARHGSDAQLEQLYRRSARTSSFSDRKSIVHALAASDDQERLQKVFNWIITLDREDKDHLADSMLATDLGTKYLVRLINGCNEEACPFSDDHLETLVESICLKRNSKVERLFPRHPYLARWSTLIKLIEEKLN